MGSEISNEMRIVRYGHPALRQPAVRVGRITQQVRDLVAGMTDLMRRANGVGLAANQVGVARRVAVVEVEDRLIPLIDPELVSAKGCETMEEGCLSLPRLYGNVARPAQVVVRARDLEGRRFKIRGEGLLARALLHELDHLSGKLFIDDVDQATLHWTVRSGQDGELVCQPTTLEEALKVFLAACAGGE